MKYIGKTFVTKVNGKEELIVISLDAHVNNVKSLAEAWSRDFKPSPRYPDKLVKAALYHDKAKEFAWTVNPFNNRIGPPERHALRGAGLYRRGRDEDYDVYIYWLICLHHSFKAEYLAEAISDIKEKESDIDYRGFARDLYLLITCDWLDSAMLNYVANADQHGSPREPHPFQEFVLRYQQGPGEFSIEPTNPFKQSVTLAFECARLPRVQFDSNDDFKGLLHKASWETKCYMIRGQNDGTL